MKRILIALVLLSTTIAQSQEKIFENEVKKIATTIEQITVVQKDSLKLKVTQINTDLEQNKITHAQAQKLKKEAATYHATAIENLVSIEEQKLQQLVQDKTNGKIASTTDESINTFSIGKKRFQLRLVNDTNTTKKNNKTKQKSKRTTSQFVFAMGVNNVLENNNFNSLNNSKYKFWQSHFYELGFTYKTRLSQKPSKTYFKYGVSFLWNNLRASNNNYHVTNGNTINLQQHTNELLESRLRHVQMTFPMHLEFDFSKNTINENTQIDRTHKGVRVGVGGFFGFKLGTRQYLEYINANGVKVETIQKNDFNTNIINYGLSAYLAYKTCGLYVKYDINPLFKNTETRNIALGVRFDLN